MFPNYLGVTLWREMFHALFIGRCEPKAPGGRGKAPDGEKKPGLGIPQPGDKEESGGLSPEIC